MRQGWTLDRTKGKAGLALIGLALLLASKPAQAENWSLPDSRLGIRTAPILLLSRTDVQRDLGFSDEQALSVQRAIHDLRARAAALKGQPDAEAIAARRAIDEAQQHWLDNQLDDQQQARLFQIDLQWEGPSAVITRPWLASQLELSEDQRQSLSQAVARQETQRNASEANSLDEHSGEQDLAEAVLAILSSEQREGWKELLGEPIQFQSAD